MDKIWNAVKSLALWQILVLFVVLFAAAGATYGGYIRANGEDPVALEEDQQIIPIRYGRLVNEVSTSGNLAFSNREVLAFGTGGTVSELFVEEGMTVSKGQTLASLDSLALATLTESKAQAELELRNAAEALEEARSVDVLILADAAEKVADARVTLQDAVEALYEAREPYTLEQIESQRKLVADTDLTLQKARESLARLELDHEILLAEARQSEADARVTLQETRQDLAEFATSYDLRVLEARQAAADAQGALDSALAAVAEFDPGHRESLAQARQEEADALLALDTARNDLEGFNSTYGQQVAEARETVANGEATLGTAIEALEDLTPDHEKSLVESRKAVADARMSLDQATMALERYEQSNRRRIDTPISEKEELEAALMEAESRLLQLLLSQESGTGGLEPSIHKLEFAVSSIRERLDSTDEALSDWTRLVSAEELAQKTLDDVIAELAKLEAGVDPLEASKRRADVELARAEFQAATEALASLETDEGAAKRKQLEAVVGLAEQRYSQTTSERSDLEAGPDSVRLGQLEAEAETVKARLTEAQRDLEDLVIPADPQTISVWEFIVSEAEAAGNPRSDVTATGWLVTARGILAALSAGADARELAAIEARVALAHASLESAVQEVSRLADGPDLREVAAAQAEETRLVAKLAQAREDLSELLSEPDPDELQLLEAQRVLAQAKLDSAIEYLEELREGPDPVAVALLEAQVESAREAMEETAILLTQAVLRAPFDGLVSQVMVEVGDEVQPRTDIVEVVDPSVVEVDGIVDEIDVLSIRLGTPARATVDALPGETIEGTVTKISPGARNQQGVVTYPITISVDVRDGLELREGLSAVASIVLREERDVLLVPQQALYGTFDEPLVRVVNSSGTLEDRAVVLGSSDEFWVSGKEGLQEGDQVAMEATEVGTSQFSFRQFRRVTGGGGPPGSGSRGSRR